jgi:hypothetical protein
MLSSITVATHETPQARYIYGDKVRTLNVDGELEPEVQDLFAAGSGSFTPPLLKARDLRELCNPETFSMIKDADANAGQVELDLGTGVRPYSVTGDAEGNLRLHDRWQSLNDGPSQMIYLGNRGNRVALSTLVEDGDNKILQSVKMNLTRSGQFYCSEEALELNSRATRRGHDTLLAEDFSPARTFSI